MRTRQRQVRLTDRQVDEMASAYQSGCSIQECVERFGVHRTTVMNHLEKRGIKRRFRKMTDADGRDALARYRSGEPVVSIAEYYGVDPETIRRHMRRLS